MVSVTKWRLVFDEEAGFFISGRTRKTPVRDDWRFGVDFGIGPMLPLPHPHTAPAAAR